MRLVGQMQACYSGWSYKRLGGDSALCVFVGRDIHEPVPLFKQEIRRPVERFLQRIAPGKAFQRANWGVGGPLSTYLCPNQTARSGV